MKKMSLKNLENLQETSSTNPATPPPLLSTTAPTPPPFNCCLNLPPLITTSSSTTHHHSHHGEAEPSLASPNPTTTSGTVAVTVPTKDLQDTSRNSDSGKSSSCSPTLLDCSFDSGIAGVLLDTNDMQLHKRIQQCQRILLALERERENFCTIRNRLSKISDRKKKTPADAECFCNVCCAEIDPEDAKTFVKCYICQKHICRSIKCADWLPKTAQWECELCQSSKESMAQTSSWVADQISFNQQKLVYPVRARSEIFIPISECNDSSIHFESVSQIGANSALITAEQKLKIREYVEEIVSQLLGGNLDTISVNQLSKSENYLPAPKTNGHHYPNGSIVPQDGSASRESTPGPDFTDISEARLRNMIQKIIAETVNMPPLSKTHAVSEIALDRPSKMAENGGLNNGHRHRTEHYFEPTIYQDLLATAVLNKIVDKQLNNNRTMAESTPNLTRGAADGEGAVMVENYNIENQSITSGSSVEPRSDCSYTDTEPNITTNEDKSSELLMHAGRDSVMSDYLAGHMVPLPDLSTIATESEEDDYISVTSSAVGDSTWENNWLFKKKKSTLGTGNSVSTSSIGMLVPDPKEDVRAQIGDKTADEISDLSELGSDTDDSSMDILRSNLDPINNRLFSKHLIGGQNSKMVLDELIERSSMISNTLPMDQEEAYTETRNDHVVDAPSKTEAINTNVSQQQSNDNNNQDDQKDMEVLIPPTGFEDTNSIPLSDQLSRDYTNHTDESSLIITSLEEDIIASSNKDILVDKLTKMKTKKTITTTRTRTTNITTSNSTNTTITTSPSDKIKIRNNPTSAATSSKRTISISPSQSLSPRPRRKQSKNHKMQTTKAVERTNESIATGLVGSSSNNVGPNVVNGSVEKPHNSHHENDDDDEDEDDDVSSLPHFVPGSIAEREYKKWYNAVDMPNNPYAPEALKRRISGSQERFIDLPNISPSTEQCPMEMITKEKLENDEADKRESDYRRYSRDYYINDSSKSSQTSSPPRETSKDAIENEQKPEHEPQVSPEPSFQTLTLTTQKQEEEILLDLYKAIPAQVVEDSTASLSIETISQQSIQSGTTTTSEDSDTIKIYDFKKQETTKIPRDAQEKEEKVDHQVEEDQSAAAAAVTKERPSVLNLSRQESIHPVVTTATRGSTPTAFKFLQPKRKLLDPSQVLTAEDDQAQAAAGSLEKPVIEEEVAHALPSVKALAKAFLVTSSSERIWPRNPTTKSPTKKAKLLEAPTTEVDKSEEDITITSDLSSLETDSSSACKKLENTKDQISSPANLVNTPTKTTPPSITTTTGNVSPVPVRHGVLKNNIAFFENLKFK